MESDAWKIADERLRNGSLSRDARESFATTCSDEPRANAAILSCGVDAIHGELQRLSDEVLPNVPRPAALSPRWHGEYSLPEGVLLASVQITEIGNLWLRSETEQFKVDLLGDPAPTGIGDRVLEVEATRTFDFGTWVFEGQIQEALGAHLGIARRNLLTGDVLRQLLIVEDGVATASACALVGDTWFVWEEEIWLVRQTGGRVRWGPLR